jgi:hypothetical protein
MIAVIALVVALSGCTFSKEISFGGNTTTATPTAKATTASTSPTGPTVAPGTAKVTTQGKNVIITGNGAAKSNTFKLPENWYAMKLKYDGSTQAGRMDYIDIELTSEDENSSTGVGLSQAGTHVYYEGIHYPETSASTTDTYYIKTLEPTAGSWTVELTAPPAESGVATAPHTFTGTGPALVGPVKLPTRNGKATITYNGPKEYFSVSFYQQDINYPNYPSFFIDLSDASMDNIGSSGIESPITKTVDIDNYDPNLMLLMSIDGPPTGTWSIAISPA